MSNSTSPLRTIIRSTSLVGGLQVFIVLVNIIKSKLIAVFLGPSGLGLFGILTSTLGLISVFTNFGLSISAVKKITETRKFGKLALGEAIYIVSMVAIVTGLFGTITALMFSNTISKIAFDTEDYSSWIKILSITLLISQLTAYRTSLFQGIGRLGLLVKTNFFGSLGGLVITLPLFFIQIIRNYLIPLIVISYSLSTFLSSFYFENKVKVKKSILPFRKVLPETLALMKIGFFISLSLLLGTASSYGIQLVITKIGGLQQVGFYLAGFAIINNYVGIIFSAMATEYYPRLALNADNFEESENAINLQSSLLILALAPLLIIFIVLFQPIIIVLYSEDFLLLQDLLYWATLGIYFKCLGWPIAYYFLAAGANKIYFYNELIAVIYSFVFSSLGYYFFGLRGIGLAYLATQILYFIQCFFVSKILYNISVHRKVLNIFLYNFILAIIMVVICQLELRNVTFYSLSFVVFILSVWFSYKRLRNYFKII